MRDPIERCGIWMEVYQEEFVSIETEEGLETFSESYVGKCRCHMYEVTLENIGRVSESIDRPLSYCKNFIAFKPSTSWASLREWFESLIFWEIQRKFKEKKYLKKMRKRYR